jgi:hypothetical protein
VEDKTKLNLNSLDYWKAEIRAGIRYRTIFGKSKEWERYKKMYRGLWAEGVVPVNIIYALGRSMIPQIYFRNPRVNIKPRRPGYAMHARVLERIDNYLINETGLKHQLKRCILDCYLCGRGPGIVGYDSEYGFNPSFLSDELADLSLTQFNKSGQKIEYVDNIKAGYPWFMRANPSDFIVPWGTSAWDEARWYALRKMRPLRDIKEDPKYTNTASLKAPFKSALDKSTEAAANNATKNYEEDSQNEWAELWEVHDKRSGLIYALTLDHDKFLRIDKDYLQVEGLNADVLGFNEDPDYFWWTPDCRLVEVQQLEMNDIRTMAKKHRRVALLKVLYDRGMLSDKDEITKLLDGDPKAAVAIDAGVNGDVRKAVALFQSHVPPDLLSAAREVREDVREIVGFSRNQMGSFEESSGRRTAHEAEIVRAASMIRIDERRDTVADFLERIMRKENQLIFDNWSAERVIDIIGPNGVRYWVRFTGKEIKGEFTYGVNPEETIPEDKRTRREEALQFMQVAANVPGLDMKYLLESYADNLGDWLDPKMLFPADEGVGRSPEKAMPFTELMRMGGGQSNFPALGGG